MMMYIIISRLDALKKAKSGKSQLWNKILDIHLAIHSNPNPLVQSQIHQPTDFGGFDVISKKIDGFRSARDTKLFTGLSDEYQKQKFINANAGKALVGVFANDMSFNALIQGKDIALLSNDSDMPFSVQFGDKISNGNLSNPYTLETQAKIEKLEEDTIYWITFICCR
jgi:hypothetical protein